jgi:hypothetical protein
MTAAFFNVTSNISRPALGLIEMTVSPCWLTTAVDWTDNAVVGLAGVVVAACESTDEEAGGAGWQPTTAAAAQIIIASNPSSRFCTVRLLFDIRPERRHAIADRPAARQTSATPAQQAHVADNPNTCPLDDC